MHCQKWSLASALLQVHHYFAYNGIRLFRQLFVQTSQKRDTVNTEYFQKFSH